MFQLSTFQKLIHYGIFTIANIKKHVIGLGKEGRKGGAVAGAERTVFVLTDQSFPAVLPTASGNCLCLIILELGNMDDSWDLLASLIPRGGFLEPGTIILAGSLTNLSLGLASYCASAVKLVRRFAGLFKGCVNPFLPFTCLI